MAHRICIPANGLMDTKSLDVHGIKWDESEARKLHNTEILDADWDHEFKGMGIRRQSKVTKRRGNWMMAFDIRLSEISRFAGASFDLFRRTLYDSGIDQRQ
jgi:hypothetical protein